MSDIISRYKNLDYKLSDKNIAWRMYEAGVENFGKNGADVLPVPEPGDNEVLLRVDTIGVCFSDVKMITQGSGHARITGRDLPNDPALPGHEVSLTVIKAGKNYADTYKPKERFIMQADVFYKGASIAWGYVLPGGMQQFALIDDRVLKGDEGSYIIPVKNPNTGYAEAALVEPWTCVVASYRIQPRKHLQAGGVTLILEVEPGNYSIDGAICTAGAPGKIILSGVSDDLKSRICGCGGCSAEVIEIGKLNADAVKALSDERTGGKGFDDVIILGTPDTDLMDALMPYLAKRSVMAIVADKPLSKPLKVDVGRVHYDFIDYIGTDTGNVVDAYSKSRDSEFVDGGAAWFIGAAGPMGQMHVHRAVGMENGPKKILCSDVDNARLDYLKSGVGEIAAAKGIELVFVNPVVEGNDALLSAISKMTDGKGFDDIVILAPVPVLIEGAIPHLAKGGLMNIFAGLARGVAATIDLSVTFLNGNRFVGSSGSRPQDMVDTLSYTENGQLPTRSSMAAVGGIDAIPDGVLAVKEARFPGKTVIFPHIQMPLTALTELESVLPNVYAKLKDGKFWTPEAEEELLRTKLSL